MPLPPGTNLAVLYYQHSHGDHLYGHGDEVNIPFRLNTDIGVARYVRYLSAFGMLADVQAILPFGSVRMSEPASLVAHGSRPSGHAGSKGSNGCAPCKGGAFQRV